MAKETASSLKVIAVIASLVTAILLGGIRVGRTEKDVEAACQQMVVITKRQQEVEGVVAEIRREMAYQKGVVTTKLESLELGQQQIMEIISQWEPINEQD